MQPCVRRRNELPPAIFAGRHPDPVRAEKFAAPDALKKSDPAAADKHMRQGSASAFRHVAPALLLC
jgi:hypothetical protein